jgi:stage III sporulation protein AE
MKKYLLLLILIFLLPVPAFGADVPEEITKALPSQAEDIVDTGSLLDFSAFQTGLSRLWEKLCGSVTDVVRSRIGGAVLLLTVVVLCGLADDLFRASQNTRVANYVPMVGAMAITVLTAGSFNSLLEMGKDTIEELDVFAKALLPTLSAAVAASGGVVSASIKQVGCIVFAEAVLSLIRELLVPLVCFYVGVAAVNAMLPQSKLSGLGEMLRKGITWILGAAIVLFSGYLTITGAVAGSADALSIRLTKSAISTAVPVVGSIISDVTDSVVSGAGVLKNSIGVVGLLAVLAVCLLPFLELAVQYLLYKITAFLAGTVGSGALVDLLSALGSAFGLILGMAGTSALLLLISIISSVSVVT